jgi:hypothetical protein
MATVPYPARWSVEQLLHAVDHLSPAERLEFQRRLAAHNGANGTSKADEATLMRTAKKRLPAEDERRLKRLIGKSERGRLTESELAEYQKLAEQAQQIDVERVWARAELIRHRQSKAGAEAGRTVNRKEA